MELQLFSELRKTLTPVDFCILDTVVIRINVAAIIQFLALTMRRLFEAGVKSSVALNRRWR